MVARRAASRPVRDMLLQLPLLPTTPDLQIDYAAADPAVLLQLAENIEVVIETMLFGLSAVGTFMAKVAPSGDEISTDTSEALGWFISDIADAAVLLGNLAATCRQYTADYAPPTRESPVMAKPWC